jgi:hypothetical protein
MPVKPYTSVVATSRRRLGVILRGLVAIYIVAVAAMPFAHHDIVCHLKSSTHCTTCHVGTSGDQSSIRPALARVDLADSGQPHDRQSGVPAASALSPSAGRAPPLASVFTL